MNREKLLEAVSQYLTENFALKGEAKEILQTLLAATYDAGVVVGYHLQKYPEATSFMAALKSERTVHTKCGLQLFPMWTGRPELKKIAKLLWWCSECCVVVDKRSITIDIVPLEDQNANKNPEQDAE
jgi:hypothetical protein